MKVFGSKRKTYVRFLVLSAKPTFFNAQRPAWTPQLPSNVPQIPTIKGHKDSIKGVLGVLLNPNRYTFV